MSSGKLVVGEKQIAPRVATYHDCFVGNFVTGYALSVPNYETSAQSMIAPKGTIEIMTTNK
jgi:hypothetical protein